MPVVSVLVDLERLLSKATSTNEPNRRSWFLTRHWITSFQLFKTKHRPRGAPGKIN